MHFVDRSTFVPERKNPLLHSSAYQTERGYRLEVYSDDPVVVAGFCLAVKRVVEQSHLHDFHPSIIAKFKNWHPDILGILAGETDEGIWSFLGASKGTHQLLTFDDVDKFVRTVKQELAKNKEDIQEELRELDPEGRKASLRSAKNRMIEKALAQKHFKMYSEKFPTFLMDVFEGRDVSNSFPIDIRLEKRERDGNISYHSVVWLPVRTYVYTDGYDAESEYQPEASIRTIFHEAFFKVFSNHSDSSYLRDTSRALPMERYSRPLEAYEIEQARSDAWYFQREVVEGIRGGFLTTREGRRALQHIIATDFGPGLPFVASPPNTTKRRLELDD